MRPGRGLVVTGSVLTVASILGVIFSIWWFVSGLVGGVNELAKSPTFTTPVQAQPIDLEQGGYVVYVIETAGTNAVSASDVSVTGPPGALAVTPSTGETFSNNDASFRSVAKFTTPSAGSYTLTVNGTPDTPVLVSKGVFGIFKVLGGAGLAIGIGAVASLAFVLGVVLLIIGLVRGRRPSPPGGPGTPGGPGQPWGGPPPGYGPPGYGSGYPPQQAPGYSPGYYPPQPPPGPTGPYPPQGQQGQ